MSIAQQLHKLMSPMLYMSGVYSQLWNRRSCQEPFTVVLVYHRVVEDGFSCAGRFGIERGVSASVFEAQIRFMIKHFSPIKASETLESSSERLRFAVTLDDGYEDNFLIAAPILKRLGVPATFFVASDYVATERLFWWEQLADMIRKTRVSEIDSKALVANGLESSQFADPLPLQTDTEREIAYELLSAVVRAKQHSALTEYMNRLSEILEIMPREEGRDYALMDWKQLKKLTHQGFDIGGHTASHCNVVDMDMEILHREIVSSSVTIERQLETPVLTFAYPYGHFQKSNKTVAKVLNEASCKVAFTTEKGVVEGQRYAFELPRTHLNRRYHFACGYNIQETLNHS